MSATSDLTDSRRALDVAVVETRAALVKFLASMDSGSVVVSRVDSSPSSQPRHPPPPPLPSPPHLPLSISERPWLPPPSMFQQLSPPQPVPPPTTTPPSPTTPPDLYSFPAITPAPNPTTIELSTPQTPPDPPPSFSPTLHTTHSTSLLPIRCLSPAEIEELNDRGLCYNCEQIWSETHRCRSKYLIMFGTHYDDEDDFHDPPSPDLVAGIEIKDEDISRSSILLDSESPPPPLLYPPPPPLSSSPPSSIPPLHPSFQPPLPIKPLPQPIFDPSPLHPMPSTGTPLLFPSLPTPSFNYPTPISQVHIRNPPPQSPISFQQSFCRTRLYYLPQTPLLQTPPLTSKRLSQIEIEESREPQPCYKIDQKWSIIRCYNFWRHPTSSARALGAPSRLDFLPLQETYEGEPPPLISLIVHRRLKEIIISVQSDQIQVMELLFDGVMLCGEPPPELLSVLIPQFVMCTFGPLIWMRSLIQYSVEFNPRSLKEKLSIWLAYNFRVLNMSDSASVTLVQLMVSFEDQFEDILACGGQFC